MESNLIPMSSTAKIPTSLSPDDRLWLTVTFGAGFCRCVDQAISEITPDALAKYCASRNFKPFPAMQTDADGKTRRWAFLLGTAVEKVEGVERQVNITASFGDYPDFPKSTAEGVLMAIRRIADRDQVPACEIVEAMRRV